MKVTALISPFWHRQSLPFAAAGLLGLGLAAVQPAQAQVLYSQDFNASGATTDSVGWNRGWVSGGFSQNSTIANAGVAGTGGLVTTVDVYDSLALWAETEFWADTLPLPAGAGPYTVSLTANITGSQPGTKFALVLDDHAGDRFVFYGRVESAGKFQTIGGPLAAAQETSASFNFASPGYSIVLCFVGDPSWPTGPSSLTLDNVVLKTVPLAGPVYTQQFDAAGATPGTLGWAGGFIYGGGDYEGHDILPTGLNGSGALVTTVNVTSGANLGAFTEFWSGTLKLPAGADAYNLSLTADITGSQTGAPFSLKLNDHANHNVTFNGVVGKAGTFQTVGGRLNLASSITSGFDFGSTAGYSVILALNPSSVWPNGTNTLTIDNVVLQAVPRTGTNYVQDFNAPGATPSSVGWNGGFAYSGGSGATKTITPTGVGGSGALVTSVNVTDGANLGAFTEYWSGTFKLPPASSADSLMLTALVTANQSGVPFSVRFNDHATPTSHYITFSGTVTQAGTFQPIGGRLSSANSVDPNFDFASTNGYSILLTFNPSANWAAGTDTLTIDNVVIQTVGTTAQFPLQIAPSSAGQAVLSWNSLQGRDYAVQFQDSLTGGSWLNLASPVRAAGTTTSFTNSTTSVPMRFYRIEAQ